jgi:ATP-dependent DNA helicase RecG
VQYRPRRQLVVTVGDGSDTCVLRFFSFYPSQQKALAPGAQLRIRGELKGGFLGWQMVHPTYRPAGGELPDALTPVYSTVASLPQAYLRKAVASGLARADLTETIPADAAPPPGQATRWTLRQALQFLHHRRPGVAGRAGRPHASAWQRLKAEELLARRLSQVTSRRAHDAFVRRRCVRPGGLHEQRWRRCPSS